MFEKGPDTTMGSRTMQRIDERTLKEMTLSAHSNMVLIKVPDFKKERVTKSGILLDVNPDVQYFDQGEGSHMADLARVIGVVEKIPPALLPDGDILSWHTPMDLNVGDTVWFDYMDGMNSTSFVIGDDEYRLIPYSSCYIAYRESQIGKPICLNGYILFEDVMQPKDKLEHIDKVDPLKGKIYAIGDPVEHTLAYWTEDIEVEEGDIVEFRKKFPKVYVERQLYFQQLDRKLFRGQRKDIVFNYGKNM